MPVDAELDWDDLRYFLQARKAGALAGASRALGVEHTTVGRRLTALERTLGAALFLRGPDGLQLTSLGTELTPFVEQMERAVLALRDVAARHGRRVRLAVPSGFTTLLTSRLVDLAKDHPTLALELVSSARFADLRKGEADLAIRAGTIPDKELVTRKLCDAGWSVYAAPAYLARRRWRPESDDLGGHDVIGFDVSLAATPAAKWLDAHARGASVVLRSREMSDVVSAAAAGLGVCVLPCMLGDAEPALRRLMRTVVASTRLNLVYRREARTSEHVRAVARFVVATVTADAARISGV